MLTSRSAVAWSWIDRVAGFSRPFSGRFSLWTDRWAAGGGPSNRLVRHASRRNGEFRIANGELGMNATILWLQCSGASLFVICNL
jgi:hypothetical protein